MAGFFGTKAESKSKSIQKGLLPKIRRDSNQRPGDQSASKRRSLRKRRLIIQSLESRQLLAGDFDGVLMERFNGVSGNSLASLTGSATYPDSPDVVSRVSAFEAPVNIANNYGVRMRGYVTAPADGDYTFWLASDNHGSLLLSESDDSAAATEIASVQGWTYKRQFYKYPSQQSESITMVAGEKYYIEALMKEISGGDNLVVAWSGPGVNGPVVIAEEFLTVFQEPNHAPNATNDLISVDEDSSETVVNLLGNDTDPRGNILSVSSFTQPANGSVSQLLDGSVLFTPDHNFYGDDNFTYTVINELGITDTATVNVSVDRTQGLLLETFSGIGGKTLSQLTTHADYPLQPSSTGTLDDFEKTLNAANNYGVRARGYLTAPQTGDYTFWIAADDEGSLRLSTDHQAKNSVQIASNATWTGYRQWSKFASQQSAIISLVAGQDYYIEALMKEGWGGDNLSVAWSGPGISDGTPVVIAAEYLTAYDTSFDVPPVVDVQTQVLSGTEVRVTWSIPPSLPDSGYQVLASTDGGVNYDLIATTSVGATSAVLAGLLPETNYRFQVRGTTDAGSFANSVPAISQAVWTPESEGTNYWHQVNVVTGIRRGDAGYSGTGSLLASDQSLQAESVAAAIFDSVSGSAFITDFNDNTMEFVFGESKAYNVSTALSWQGDEALPFDWTIHQYLDFIGVDIDIEDAYVITLEDSFDWKRIDADYNDFFWVVEVTSNDDLTPGDAPGDQLADAQLLALQSGTILELDATIGDGNYPSSDVDLFKLDLTAGQTVSVDVDSFYLDDGTNNPGLDSYLRIFNESGVEFASNSQAVSANDYYEWEWDPGFDSYLTFTAGTTGTYYVGVSGEGNSSYDPNNPGSGSNESGGDYKLQLLAELPPVPEINVSDVTVSEDGVGATFEVTLSEAVSNSVTLDYTTSEGTATAINDYVTTTGSLTFAPGETLKTVSVSIVNDSDYESDETFKLNISNVVGIDVADASGLGTITNDDLPPSDPPGDWLADAQVVALTPNMMLEIDATIGDGNFPTSDVDLFKLDLLAGQSVTVDVDAYYFDDGTWNGGPDDGQLDSYLRIFNATGNQLSSNDDAEASNDYGNNTYYDSFLNFTASTTGAYYVGVSSSNNTSYDPTVLGSGSGGGSGDYWLQLLANAPPVPTISFTIPEDTAYTLGVSDFGYAEVEMDELQSITLATTPTAGTLLFNGAPLAAGAIIMKAGLDNGSVTFQPGSDEFGYNYSSFAIIANDGFHDSEPAVLGWRVTPVNDAPRISDNADVFINEGEPVGPLTFTVSDSEVSEDNLTVSITSSDQSIVSDLDGVEWAGSGSNRHLTITPEPNASGVVTITVHLSDGLLTSSTSFEINIQAFDDLASEIVWVNLLHDTGARWDNSSAIPVITGSLDRAPEEFPLSIEIDHDLDGVSDATLLIDADADEFTYDPRTVDPAFASTVGDRQLNYRLSHDRGDSGMLSEPWQGYSFTIEPPPITALKPEEVRASVSQSSDPDTAVTYRGQVGPTVDLSQTDYVNLMIQIDNDNDQTPDDAIPVSADHLFEYSPDVSNFAAHTLGFRVSFWDNFYQIQRQGQWEILDFDPDPSPTIEEIHLANDTGVSATDKKTSDTTIVGSLWGELPNMADISIELVDDDADDDVIFVGNLHSDGTFVFDAHPFQSGTVDVRIRTRTLGIGPDLEYFSPWTDFTFQYEPHDAPAVNDFRLLVDDGEFSDDKQTTITTLTGSLTPTFGETKGVEIDFDGDQTADDFATATNGLFFYDPINVTAGTNTLSYRASHWSPVFDTQEFGSWESFTFEYVPPQDNQVAITGFGLASGLGSDISINVTNDPTVVGRVDDERHGHGARIDLDLDNDGDVDDQITADENGYFRYTPQGLGFGLHVIKAQAVTYDYVGATMTAGPWASVGFTFQESSSGVPVIQSLSLLSDSDIDGDQITANSALIGKVDNDGQAAGIPVQVDFGLNGSSDLTVFTEADGTFIVESRSFAPGTVDLQLRTIEPNLEAGDWDIGNWIPFSFQYEQQTNEAARIKDLDYVPNTTPIGLAASRLDQVTGRVTNEGQLDAIRIEIDIDGNGDSDFSGLTDQRGRFSVGIAGLTDGSHSVSVRSVEYDPVARKNLYGAWELFDLESTAPSDSVASITSVSLIQDTGIPDNLITSDNRISGVVQYNGPDRVAVTIDEDNDGIRDGFALVDSAGSFQYTPASGDSNNFVVRPLVIGDSVVNYVGDEFSFAIEIGDGVAANPSLAISSLHLTLDTGPDSSDLATDNPSLTGHTEADLSGGGLILQADIDGDGAVDYNALISSSTFLYDPTDLVFGAQALQLRLVTSDSTDAGPWSSIDFGYFADAGGQEASDYVLSNQVLANRSSEDDRSQAAVQVATDEHAIVISVSAIQAATGNAQTDSNLDLAIELAGSDFDVSIGQFNGDTSSFDHQPFQWPNAPQAVRFDGPIAADQPAPPATRPTYNGPQFDFESDPTYQADIARARAAFDQAVRNAEEVKDLALEAESNRLSEKKTLAYQAHSQNTSQASQIFWDNRTVWNGNSTYQHYQGQDELLSVFVEELEAIQASLIDARPTDLLSASNILDTGFYYAPLAGYEFSELFDFYDVPQSDDPEEYRAAVLNYYESNFTDSKTQYLVDVLSGGFQEDTAYLDQLNALQHSQGVAADRILHAQEAYFDLFEGNRDKALRTYFQVYAAWRTALSVADFDYSVALALADRDYEIAKASVEQAEVVTVETVRANLWRSLATASRNSVQRWDQVVDSNWTELKLVQANNQVAETNAIATAYSTRSSGLADAAKKKLHDEASAQFQLETGILGVNHAHELTLIGANRSRSEASADSLKILNQKRTEVIHDTEDAIRDHQDKYLREGIETERILLQDNRNDLFRLEQDYINSIGGFRWDSYSWLGQTRYELIFDSDPLDYNELSNLGTRNAIASRATDIASTFDYFTSVDQTITDAYPSVFPAYTDGLESLTIEAVGYGKDQSQADYDRSVKRVQLDNAYASAIDQASKLHIETVEPLDSAYLTGSQQHRGQRLKDDSLAYGSFLRRESADFQSSISTWHGELNTPWSSHHLEIAASEVAWADTVATAESETATSLELARSISTIGQADTNEAFELGLAAETITRTTEVALVSDTLATKYSGAEQDYREAILDAWALFARTIRPHVESVYREKNEAPSLYPMESVETFAQAYDAAYQEKQHSFLGNKHEIFAFKIQQAWDDLGRSVDVLPLDHENVEAYDSRVQLALVDVFLSRKTEAETFASSLTDALADFSEGVASADMAFATAVKTLAITRDQEFAESLASLEIAEANAQASLESKVATADSIRDKRIAASERSVSNSQQLLHQQRLQQLDPTVDPALHALYSAVAAADTAFMASVNVAGQQSDDDRIDAELDDTLSAITLQRDRSVAYSNASKVEYQAIAAAEATQADAIAQADASLFENFTTNSVGLRTVEFVEKAKFEHSVMSLRNTHLSDNFTAWTTYASFPQTVDVEQTNNGGISGFNFTKTQGVHSFLGSLTTTPLIESPTLLTARDTHQQTFENELKVEKSKFATSFSDAIISLAGDYETMLGQHRLFVQAANDVYTAAIDVAQTTRNTSEINANTDAEGGRAIARHAFAAKERLTRQNTSVSTANAEVQRAQQIANAEVSYLVSAANQIAVMMSANAVPGSQDGYDAVRAVAEASWLSSLAPDYTTWAQNLAYADAVQAMELLASELAQETRVSNAEKTQVLQIADENRLYQFATATANSIHRSQLQSAEENRITARASNHAKLQKDVAALTKIYSLDTANADYPAVLAATTARDLALAQAQLDFSKAETVASQTYSESASAATDVYQRTIAAKDYDLATAIADITKQFELEDSNASGAQRNGSTAAKNLSRQLTAVADFDWETAQDNASVVALQSIDTIVDLPWTQYLVDSSVAHRDGWQLLRLDYLQSETNRSLAESNAAFQIATAQITRDITQANADHTAAIAVAASRRKQSLALTLADQELTTKLSLDAKAFVDEQIRAEWQHAVDVALADQQYHLSDDVSQLLEDYELADQTRDNDLETSVGQWTTAELTAQSSKHESAADAAHTLALEQTAAEALRQQKQNSSELAFGLASSVAYLQAVNAWASVDDIYHQHEAGMWLDASVAVALNQPSPWSIHQTALQAAETLRIQDRSAINLHRVSTQLLAQVQSENTSNQAEYADRTKQTARWQADQASLAAANLQFEHTIAQAIISLDGDASYQPEVPAISRELVSLSSWASSVLNPTDYIDYSSVERDAQSFGDVFGGNIMIDHIDPAYTVDIGMFSGNGIYFPGPSSVSNPREWSVHPSYVAAQVGYLYQGLNTTFGPGLETTFVPGLGTPSDVCLCDASSSVSTGGLDASPISQHSDLVDSLAREAIQSALGSIEARHVVNWFTSSANNAMTVFRPDRVNEKIFVPQDEQGLFQDRGDEIRSSVSQATPATPSSGNVLTSWDPDEIRDQIAALGGRAADVWESSAQLVSGFVPARPRLTGTAQDHAAVEDVVFVQVPDDATSAEAANFIAYAVNTTAALPASDTSGQQRAAEITQAIIRDQMIDRSGDLKPSESERSSIDTADTPTFQQYRQDLLGDDTWPRLTEAEKRQAAGLPTWWAGPLNLADAEWIRQLERVGRELLVAELDVYAATESLGRATGQDLIDEQLFNTFKELDKVQFAYDRYLTKLIEREELLVAYHQSTNFIVGAYVSAITSKLNTFGLHPNLDSFLIPKLQQTSLKLATAMGVSGGRADSALFKLQVANGVVTAASLVVPVGAAVRVAATQAAIKGGTSAAIRAGVAEAVKQAAITSAVAGGVAYALPYAVEKSGLELHQIELGMAALEAFGVLRSLKYIQYSRTGWSVDVAPTGARSRMFDPDSFNPIVKDYWGRYFEAVGRVGDDVAATVKRLQDQGFIVRPGPVTARLDDGTIEFGPDAKIWELYEEVLHHSVSKGLGNAEISSLGKELKKKFGLRRIRGGNHLEAAEEIFVKETLLQRLDLDSPTRAFLEAQILKLNTSGLSGGY